MNTHPLSPLSNSVVLAPLSGISSLPFRIINRQFGCRYAFLEMVHARSLSYGSKKTQELMRTDQNDRPLGIQLLGNEPYFLEKAVEQLDNHNYDVLDFNAACPRRKITRKGEGASLLQTPKKLRDLLKIIIKHTRLPVTAKIRLGWNDTASAYDIARCVQDAGAAAVFIHGRTKTQGYSGSVDYGMMRNIKKILSIPVIASGNIFNAELAKRMFEQTGCDGITVARGALGNPWIFRDIYEFLKKGTMPPPPGVDEIADTIKKHFNLCIAYFGEKRGVPRFRKFYVWYTRGIQKIKHLRRGIMHIRTKEAMVEAIEEFRKQGERG